MKTVKGLILSDTFRRLEAPETGRAARHFDTGEERVPVRLNSPIHHVNSYGANRFVFCHPATENGMLMTDLRGGWYTHLRTMDASGGCICHHASTGLGLAYEVLGSEGAGTRAGLYNPDIHEVVDSLHRRRLAHSEQSSLFARCLRPPSNPRARRER